MLENNVRVIALARAMAAHAATRQALIARNVAQADTPGYRPKDLPPFSRIVSEIIREGPRVETRHNAPRTVRVDEVDASGVASPNGNAVSLEAEMMRAAAVRNDHDMALAIQAKLSGVVRAALGRSR